MFCKFLSSAITFIIEERRGFVSGYTFEPTRERRSSVSRSTEREREALERPNRVGIYLDLY